MDCMVHGVAKSRTRLNDFHLLSCLCPLHFPTELMMVERGLSSLLLEHLRQVTLKVFIGVSVAAHWVLSSLTGIEYDLLLIFDFSV